MSLLTEADCLRATVASLKAQKDCLVRKNEIKNRQIAALENKLLDTKAELEVEKQTTNKVNSMVKTYCEESKALQQMKFYINSLTSSTVKDGLTQAINHAIEANDKAFKIMLEKITTIGVMEDTYTI